MEGRKKKENEQLDKIDGGAICEFKIQACFPQSICYRRHGQLTYLKQLQPWRDGLQLANMGRWGLRRQRAKALWTQTPSPGSARVCSVQKKPACARLRELGRNKQSRRSV